MVSDCHASQPGAVLLPRGHLTQSGGIFDCHDWRDALASSEQRPGMLQTSSNAPAPYRPAEPRIIWPQMPVVPTGGKPWVSGKENNMFKGTKLLKGLEDLKGSDSSGVKQPCGVSEGNCTGEAGNVGGARGRSCTPTTKFCCTDNQDFLGELKGQARADSQHDALPPRLP